MSNPPEPEPGRPTAGPAGARGSFDWSRLLRSDSPDDVLEEIGRWLGSSVHELRLISSSPPETRIGAWREQGHGTPSGERRSVVVRGEPDWKLWARVRDADAMPGAVDRAALLLEAWRQARGELKRAEGRLAARTRELDVLQSLGRRAAEARTPAELFASTLSVLQPEAELDLALVGCEWEGSPEMTVFLARPFSEPYVEVVAQRASRFLGWSTDPVARPVTTELDAYDSARGARQAFREEDLILLPLMRGGQPVACLLLVPAGEAGEGQLRMLFSASNLLSLHLDRILTVQEAEADRFRSIVDSMPQGVLLADDRLRVLQANRSARQLFAASGLPLTGELESTLDRLKLRGLVDRVRGGRSTLAEGEAHPEEGRVWSVTVSPLLGRRGLQDGLVLVLSDVTDRRRLQQQLSQADKMSSLGQMISGVAHELNNPLSSILGYAQLLRTTSQDGRLGHRLEILRREAERCRKIVQNLLSFARRHEPERKPLSLNQVVQSAVALLAYQLRVDDIRVRCDLSPDLPSMQGDAHQLEQVLVNLLTNAQQAIRQTEGAGAISLRTEPRGTDAVALEVTDTGPGIPESARGRIFDPFFTTKGPGEGTGLGLSLVYGIVTGHGGSIEAGPGPGRGTRITVVLPLGEEPREAKTVDRPVAVPKPARRGRILVVDDEEPVARLICDALAVDGHETRRAGDGREALARLAEAEYDLIISDIKMPAMDGERFSEELSRTRPGMARRLVLTTGDTLSDEPDEIVARTGLEVLHKPFDLDELRRLVRARLDDES